MTGIWTPTPSLEDLFDLLRTMPEEYDPALLSARRASFQAAIEAADPDTHEWQAPSIRQQMDDAGFGHSGQL